MQIRNQPTCIQLQYNLLSVSMKTEGSIITTPTRLQFRYVSTARDREGVGDRNNPSRYVVYLNYSNYRTDGYFGVKCNLELKGNIITEVDYFVSIKTVSLLLKFSKQFHA